MPRAHPAPLAAVPAAYRALFKYLDSRFLDTVILRFDQIEALLPFPLPVAARREQTWWTDVGTGKSSMHARSWINAHRIAIANLEAETVRFQRIAREPAATAPPVTATHGAADPGLAQGSDHGAAHRMDDDGGWQPTAPERTKDARIGAPEDRQ